MINQIVRTPVLDALGQVLLPTGTVLNDEVMIDLAFYGIDTIDTYTGTWHIPDIRESKHG